MNKSLLIILSCLFISVGILGQSNSKFDVGGKFINFDETRLSGALDINLGYSSLNSTTSDFSKGSKAGVGLLMDIYNPYSVVGFTTGVAYSLQEHKFGVVEEGSLIGDSISISNFEIPLFIKFRIGSVSSGQKFIIMTGATYHIVSNAEINSDFFSPIEDKNMAKNYLNYRLQLGYEIALGRKSKKEFGGTYVSDARTRLVFYLGTSYAKSSMYNQDYDNIPDTTRIKFIDIGNSSSFNIYGGVSLYYTLNEWGEIGDTFINELTN